MLSVFDRIRKALTDDELLSKVELFSNANIPNTKSNRALFQILVENSKLIPIGKGRARKYCLPLMANKLPQEGIYKFSQKGDGPITFQFNEEEPQTFPNYEECVIFIKRRLTNDG